MSKATKRYKDSPKLERNEDSGKMGITRKKGEENKKKEDATEVAAGTDQIEMHQRHAKERLDLHHKHETEYMDMAQKQTAEGAPADSEEAGEPIKKIEKDKKE